MDAFLPFAPDVRVFPWAPAIHLSSGLCPTTWAFKEFHNPASTFHYVQAQGSVSYGALDS